MSEPAPESGLEVTWTSEDSDEALGDIELLLSESTNILEFEGLADGDVPTGAVVTIAPGATEATVVFAAISDELSEEPETTTYTLQPGSGYVVDSENFSLSPCLLVPLSPCSLLPLSPNDIVDKIN